MEKAVRHKQLWVGIDAGKGHHWAAAVDATGTSVWSRKVENDETAILDAITEAIALADELHWGIDIAGTSSALLLALLAAHGQKPVYVPGRTVNRMSGAYRGEAKTDARDAYVIAETVRHRRDFTAVDVPTQLVEDLALLTGAPHRPGRRQGEAAEPAPLELLDTFKAKGIRFRSLRDGIITDPDTEFGGAMAQAMITIISAFAQLERDQLSERTRAGMAAAAANGRRAGRREVTFDDPRVKRARELKAQGLRPADIGWAGPPCTAI